MRIAVVAAAVCLSIVGLSEADQAKAAMRVDTRIPAESLGPALKSLAQDRNIQILYFSDAVRDVHTGGAVGQLTMDEALTQLLSGTGLTYRYVSDKAITILPASTSSSGVGSAPSSPSTSPPSTSTDSQKEGNTGSSGAFLLAQAASGQNASTSAIEKKSEGGAQPTLQEIIVTAQKRAERLIDTPQSVSVVSSADLDRLAATQFVGFANSVPGLSFNTVGAGYTAITLRGVTSGYDIAPTVGLYVDDVPYGAASGTADSTRATLDVGLFDIARIEVLRGPQGTLYGASTMGGLIRYVSVRPDTQQFGGDVQIEASETHFGGTNCDVAGAFNTPLVNQELAIRASAYEFHDAGFIDNLARNRTDVNESDIYGGRLDVLATPTSALTIRLTGFLQNIARDGEGTVDYSSLGPPSFGGAPLYGALDQRRPYGEPFSQQFRLGSGTITYDFGPATLTSISSYQSSHGDYTSDDSGLLSFTNAAPPGGLGRTYSALGFLEENDTDKFTQEVRLASNKPWLSFEWLLGAFYTRENSKTVQSFAPLDAVGDSAPNDLFLVTAPQRYQESAVFGDLTWHLTKKLDATGGIRYAHNQTTDVSSTTGLLIGTSVNQASSNLNVATYLGNVRYHFGDLSTGYLRYATGYRPGGPNIGVIDFTTGQQVGPATYQADRLSSYEIGYKAETADRRFAVDAAGYYIDWSNIQISVVRNNIGFIDNAPGGATVLGSELTVTAHPIEEFTGTGSFAYQHAYLKEADADLGAAQGERLPNVPRFTAAVNGDYSLPAREWAPTIGATVRYVSDRMASFDDSAGFPQLQLPSYAVVDLRSSLQIGRFQGQLYVHNLLDKRAELSAYTFNGLKVAIMQPRTVGVRLVGHF
jgi:iron complex outermembrane recepter protein